MFCKNVVLYEIYSKKKEIILLMNQQQNLDIFFRSVVGSLEGAVSYSVSTNKTDGRVLHCQKFIILKRQCLKSHFTYMFK
jgi:hypothetical protein